MLRCSLSRYQKIDFALYTFHQSDKIWGFHAFIVHTELGDNRLCAVKLECSGYSFYIFYNFPMCHHHPGKGKPKFNLLPPKTRN